MCVLVAQLTECDLVRLCDLTDCSPPGFSVHGILQFQENSPGNNTGVDCHSLLQRNLPTQGLNTGLLHCRQVLYCLSYREVLFGQLVLSKSDKDKILFPANSQLGTSVELLLLMTKVSSFPGTLKVKYGSILSCKEL